MSTLVAERISYDVTPDDRIWLLRAVEAEGAPQTRVAQALISGYLAACARGYRYPLATYVRAYAQPVNPRWYETGDLFRARLEKAKTAEERARLTDAARSRPKKAARTTFSPTTIRAVEEALRVDAAISAA